MKAISTLGAAVLFFGQAHGATLAQYTFQDGAGAFTTAATSRASTVTPGSLTTGTGISAIQSSGVNFPNTSGARAGYFSVVTANTSIDSAVTANQFFTLSLAAASGNVMNLETLSWTGNIAVGNSAKNITLQINTGSGYTTVGTYFFTASDKTNSTAPTTAPTPTFDLSGYSGLSSATLRFVLWDDVGGITGGASMRMDDLTITGSTSVIPEPTAALLGGVAGMTLLLRRRR